MVAETLEQANDDDRPDRILGRLEDPHRQQDQPREGTGGRLRYRALQALFALPLYDWTLRGQIPTALMVAPSDPWPGDAAAGEAILQGAFTCNGQRLLRPAPMWQPLGVERNWCLALHGFDWLRDLRALGGDAARRGARDLVADWLDHYSKWDALAWEPAAIGRRLTAWLGHYDFFAASADVAFRHRLLGSMQRQARHLARVLPADLRGLELLESIEGLLLASLALPGQDSLQQRGLELLRSELARQLLPDGGHVERCPARQLALLRDLVVLRSTYHAAELEVPADLQVAIEQSAPLLRLLRHGDGGLALFNGGNAGEGWLVDMILQHAGGKGPTLMAAPMSGFQRMQAGRSLVLVDAGDPPGPGYDTTAHAGTLSFEMSVGRERMIVNCGAHPGEGEWRQVQRTTAAHSTLCLGDRNSSELLEQGALGERQARVTCRRDTADGMLLLELSQDGYQPIYGLSHRRRIFLSANGEDLRGEDRLEGAEEAVPGTAFTIRFHLHPDVTVGLAQGGASALLRLPKGGGWRFRAQGAKLAVEPSVYLGDAGAARRTQQVVLQGRSQGAETVVKWALQRESKARGKR